MVQRVLRSAFEQIAEIAGDPYGRATALLGTLVTSYVLVSKVVHWAFDSAGFH
jgi:hypothetical protein